MSTTNFNGLENNLATKDPNFRSLEEKWDMVDSLWGGTDEMRAAGQRYLPKATNERDVDYANRLSHSTLFNFYKQTLLNAVFHLTANGVQFSNTNPLMEDFMNNVDLEGRDIEQFTHDVLGNSIHYGITYVMVDFTATDINSEQEDSIAGEDRPYWVEIKPTQVMSFRSVRYQGSEVLSYFRFLETINDDGSDPSGYTSFESFNSQKFSDQIREYFLDLSNPLTPVVNWRVWRRSEENAMFSTKGEQWVLWDEGTMDGVERIPIIPVYSNRTAFYLGEPTFGNLAELNVRHWQSYSDQANLLHYARFPILFATGIDETDQNGVPKEIEIGANTVQYTSNPNADLKFVEHSGKAVESGWKDIDVLVQEMQKFGVEPSMESTGNVTATESAIHAARMQNLLKSIGNKYETALTQIFALTALYYGTDNIPIPTLTPDIMGSDNTTGANDESRTRT